MTEKLKNPDKFINVMNEGRCTIESINSSSSSTSSSSSSSSSSCTKMRMNIKSSCASIVSSENEDNHHRNMYRLQNQDDINHHNNNQNNNRRNHHYHNLHHHHPHHHHHHHHHRHNDNHDNRINDNRAKNNTSTEINTRAQRRWRLLARALARSPEPLEDVEIDELERGVSVRRFTTFGLVIPIVLENVVGDNESTWYEYAANIERKSYRIEIREINKIFTANELIGFNNTGNICVWPSEECLAHYLLTNPNICRDKMVLELGGGMSCLAGVFVAKYCNPAGVTLTDGNVTSVDNARCIVDRNKMNDFIKCGVVQWERSAKAIRQDNANANHVRQTWGTTDALDVGRGGREGLYDVILSADCLFFDEARLDLVETIFGWLSEDGVALIVAPRRGSTFQKFTDAAIARGFLAKQKEIYDPKVWSRHLELVQKNRDYCPDLHYPVLLELTKQKAPG